MPSRDLGILILKIFSLRLLFEANLVMTRYTNMIQVWGNFEQAFSYFLVKWVYASHIGIQFERKETTTLADQA